MEARVITSYLVSLGWKIDQPGLAKFEGTLKQVSTEIESHTTGIAKLFVGAAGAIVGAYAAIGVATIGLADHVAQSDLGFQLFALRMYMSTDAAKKLKIATDALGYSLDEIAWNPELRERYFGLIADQTKLQSGLGPDFERQMRDIRDVRFEFTRLEVELQYGLMHVVADLSKAFGLDEGGLLKKIKDFNRYVQDNLPELSQNFTNHLVPVLKTVWSTLNDVVSTFLTFVGDLYGDEKLKTGAITLDNVARAAGHINDSFQTVLATIRQIGAEIDAHPYLKEILEDAFIGAASASVVPGVGTGAGAALGASFGVVKVVAGKVSAADSDEYDRGDPGSMKRLEYLWRTVIGNQTAVASNRLGGRGAEDYRNEEYQREDAEKMARLVSFWHTITGQGKADKERLISTIIGAAKSYNVPPQIALAVAQQESGLNPFARVGSSGEVGPFQLMPGTARNLGVKNPWDVGENVAGGVKLLSQLFDKFHDWELAIAAYNSSTAYRTGKIPPSVMEHYVRSVEGNVQKLDVGGINVYVTNSNASPHDIAQEVMKALDRKTGNQVQRNIAQLSGSY